MEMMMKQLSLSATVDLPSDAFEASAVYRQVEAPWNALVGVLNDMPGVAFTAKAKELQTRAKPKQPRKPRKPRLVETPPPEAA
jgi:hypothetical protein